jgi:hypothetical protein
MGTPPQPCVNIFLGEPRNIWLYIPRLIEEYIGFYITPILDASPDGEPPKHGIQQK